MFLRILFLLLIGPLALAQVSGQGETQDMARLRAIRAALLPYGLSVDSSFYEKTTQKGTQFEESYLVRVNVNSLPGISILKEDHRGSTWTVWVNFDKEAAIEGLRKNLLENLDGMTALAKLPHNTNRDRALIVLREEVAHEQEMLQTLVRKH